jgi:hypothetical protein
MTFKRGTINVGLKETIKQESIDSGFYPDRRAEDLEDIELVRYVAAAGRTDWFDFLIAGGDLLGRTGKVKKAFRNQFNESLNLAINHYHAGIAGKLFSMGAKPGYLLNYSLQRVIINNQHEMAELLFKMGGKIRHNYRLAECMAMADDRMKEIIKKNIFELVSKRFRR